MLIQYFAVFVNFTVTNFQFLRSRRKCKLTIQAENCRFSSPTPHLKTQTRRGFQRKTPRWQNTIFSFLRAQLDFLAKFFKEPYHKAKYQILSDSSKVNWFPIFDNSLDFIVRLAWFYRHKTALIFTPKKMKNRAKTGLLPSPGRTGQKMPQKWLLGSILGSREMGFGEQFYPTLQVVRDKNRVPRGGRFFRKFCLIFRAGRPDFSTSG